MPAGSAAGTLPVMTRDQAIQIMREHADEIRARGVTRLALFGSIARDEAHDDSDIDVVVDIDPTRKFSIFDLCGLRLFLCDTFGVETDVVIRKDLKPRFQSRIAVDEVPVL